MHLYIFVILIVSNNYVKRFPLYTHTHVIIIFPSCAKLCSVYMSPCARPPCFWCVWLKLYNHLSIKAGDTSAGGEVSRVDPRVAIHCIPLSTLKA